MCRMDRIGFPRTSPKSVRTVRDFWTGDLVRAVVPDGRNRGTHFGRVMVRSTGRFAIRGSDGKVDGITYRHCQMVQRNDGYTYKNKKGGEALSSPA